MATFPLLGEEGTIATLGVSATAPSARVRVQTTATLCEVRTRAEARDYIKELLHLPGVFWAGAGVGAGAGDAAGGEEIGVCPGAGVTVSSRGSWGGTRAARVGSIGGPGISGYVGTKLLP